MEGQLILALVLGIPVTILPAAFVWYLNIGGIHAAVREARARTTAGEPTATEKTKA